jgi:Dolichyl-phosphate-mannose-protein mannosyltransferase
MGMAMAIKPQTRHASRMSRGLGLVHRSVREYWDVWILLILLTGFGVFELVNLNGSSTEYDEGVYWQSLRDLAQGHPLFSSVFSSQPPLFLVSILPLYLLAGQTLAAARLVVVAYGMIGLFTVWWLGRRIGGPLGGTLACVLLVSEPMYVISAHKLDAEIPMLAMALASVVFAEASMLHVGGRRVLIALSGAFWVIAFMIKFFAVAALIPIVIYTALPSLNALADGGWMSAATRRSVASQLMKDLGLLSCAIVATLALVLLPFANRLDRIYDQTIQFHIAASQTVSLRWQDALLTVWGTEWPTAIFKGALFGFVLCAIVASHHKLLHLAPVMVWLVLSFVELVQQRPLQAHHFVILSPLLALVLGTAVALILRNTTHDLQHIRKYIQKLGPAIRVVAAVALIVLVLVISGRNLQRSVNALHSAGTHRIDAIQQAMVRSLQDNVSPENLVVSDDQYIVALAHRSVPPELVDTSLVRIQAGYLTSKQLEATIVKERVSAILFARGRLASVVGFQDWVEGHFTLVKEFDQGHLLYVLPSAVSWERLSRSSLQLQVDQTL